MKQLLPLFFMCLFVIGFASAQTTVTGKILEKGTEDPLIGATVMVLGTTQGTITDIDGFFSLELPGPGEYELQMSYTGFLTDEFFVEAGSGTTDMGTINLEVQAIGLQEVEVIASVAVDRKTPVAVSTIQGEMIEAQIGNQEYPEILRKTPSIYVTKEGGGFGDARINVRGFDSQNTAVMINGIPVNDMENGLVYWSNWAGLADVTSRLQVQRGLGASKLAVPSIGGSINIITNAAEMEKGGNFSVTVGNDGYQKYGLVLSTGLGENGWAFTLQGTHTRGNGYVDGTMFRAYSYFASLSKVINSDHTISMTALGAPQWHHQRTVGTFDPVSLRSFVDPDDTGENLTDLGIRYNHNWGMLDGEEYNWRRNFYHKPKVFVNHYWTISPKTELRTSAYMSFGRGGGTGPRGGIAGRFETDPVFLNDEGRQRFDDMVTWNSGGQVPDFDTPKYDANGNQITQPGRVSWDGSIYDNGRGTFDGENVATESNVGMVFNSSGRDITSSSMGMVRRASMNSHNWFGVLSTLEHSFSDKLIIVAGFDGRYYTGIHYRRLNDLLGTDAFFTNTDINISGEFITQEKPANALAELKNDRKLNYWNDGLVGWLGLFAQLEYNTDKISTFISLSGSNQSYKRIDYFNYLSGDDTEADGNPKQTSDWEGFLGGTVKAGLNYRLNSKHNLFVNAGFFSRQPVFDAVFINFVNQVNPDVTNEKVASVEAGYGFRSQWMNLNFNGYYTTWSDRQADESLDLPDGSEGLAIFQNIAQRHMGLELDFVIGVLPRLDLEGMVSIGNWKYTENFTANVTNTDTNQPVDTAVTIYADGLEVGDAAQTTFSLGLNYKPVAGLGIYASYYHAERLFAPYNILESQFLQEGGEVAEVPGYSLVDLGISYDFDLGGLGMTLRFNMNNLLNEEYIAELETNILDDPTTPDRNEFYDNKGWYGFGRTWNAGLKIRF